MKAKLVLLILLAIPALGMKSAKQPIVKWVITQNCSLQVNGSTNVNAFSCVIARYSNPDTILVNKSAIGGPVKLKGSIKLNVQEFDCHNSLMTKDLRKTLKSAEFPKLTIRFLNLSQYPAFGGTAEPVWGTVSIQLAGVNKFFSVRYEFTMAGKTISAIGRQTVKFSDFNIIPPRKIGGMIKTNDELNVQFNLKMTEID